MQEVILCLNIVIIKIQNSNGFDDFTERVLEDFYSYHKYAVGLYSMH